MSNDIEFLETVCERMQQVGLVQSKGDFSARMLGKGASYLTSMSARDRKVPDEVIAYLAGQLQNGIADDDATLAQLHEKAARHERDRKHRADMLEWVTRHRATEPVRDEQRQRLSSIPLSLREKLSGWLARGRVVTPRQMSCRVSRQLGYSKSPLTFIRLKGITLAAHVYSFAGKRRRRVKLEQNA